ncbi:hypothetical protein RJ639_031694 [Escallonia herrerae]|uniref:QLQ domain-containing protein n=1 Tax=Escallonia herrerae TaxID=1293975 RepID=A0AA88X374_9ASTE|nr:hypothetical protein RJ639_031694 [Escallonia herrerae]
MSLDGSPFTSSDGWCWTQEEEEEQQQLAKGAKRWQRSDEGKGQVSEGLPSIKLCLGIGEAGSGSGGEVEPGQDGHVSQQRGNYYSADAFTAAQLQQLYLQALVFHHLASGLIVPFHLLAPIWNGVLSSSASANAEIHNRLHRESSLQNIITHVTWAFKNSTGSKRSSSTFDTILRTTKGDTEC